ncbi:hypothetical protein OESDEN_11913 [Oesophagostomum dentatum]|uniref:7TM GPCR serpentine receptor class x (Srx) domain-containing protein n=1 Tax=Oesophagostomum dentatum TaxID=61180 RepID=A0A0B1SYN3_OESDE|nr:hypothetical protein OESDEN_11913 [Oesophagostomum dentatum]
MVISNLCGLLYGIVIEGIDIHSSNINKASMLVDLIISYFSTILIFFLGLNRFAAFSSPLLNERVMNKMTLHFALIGSLIMSVIISVAIFELSGCERVFQANVMTDYVQNAVYIQISNYVFYAIPLISSIFYLAVFNSLRLRRADAISVQTKALLDRAERCSLKQGLWILTAYLQDRHFLTHSLACKALFFPCSTMADSRHVVAFFLKPLFTNPSIQV